MPLSPESKHDALIEKLNHLMGVGHSNDFELKRLEREAVALAKTDAYASFVTQGILACYKNDIDSARSFHKKSLQLRDDATTKLQYASTLSNLGQFSEALEIFEGIYKKEKDNLHLINYMIDCTISCFKFHRALELLNDWKKLKPKELHKEDQLVRNIVGLMEELDLTDEDTWCAQNAYSSVVERGCRVRGRKIVIREEDGFKWLDIDFLVPATADDVFEKNYSFAEKIVECAAPSNILEHLVFRFSVYTYAD